MKRYLILAASLSVLGFASAQAQVFPSPTHDNSASITQTGNQNDARINQAVNNEYNNQGNAEIIQRRNNGVATITQTNATSAVAGGFDNTASIDQRRNFDSAMINQIHDYAATRDNRATILQVAARAEATIQQRGDANTATINQVAGSVRPTATIEQNGSSNNANVKQDGSNGLVKVSQGTYSNESGQSPDTDFSRVFVVNSGLNADISVSQVGFRHKADIKEAGANGTITVSMDGILNDVLVTQNSTDGTIDIASTGTSFSNDVTVTQELTDAGSTARVTQWGSFGTAIITQLDDQGGGGGNLAEVTQSGIGGALEDILSTITQNGGLNEAFVTQASDYAQSDILQTGVGHTANVSQ